MLGIGMGELLVILVIALLFVGPEKLPGAARALGKGLKQLRGAAENLKETVEKDKDLKDALNTLKKARASLESEMSSIGGNLLGPPDRGDTASGAPVGLLASSGGSGALDAVTHIKKPRYSIEKLAVAKVAKVAKVDAVDTAAAAETPAKPEPDDAAPAGESSDS
jgi:sec-independent protein translocase protein TatB